MEKFQIIDNFIGYATLPDVLKSDVRYLVSGSQNVLIVGKGQKVKAREGYSLWGAASSDREPIESSYDWTTSSGTVRHLRARGDQLDFYDDNSSSWLMLSDGFSAIDFQFASWWNTTMDIDLLLFVNGYDYIFDWTGAVAVLASATSNSITKSGTTTWAQERFLTAGTRQVIINGTTYAYTGGETTTTLTGVTPNPSAEAANSTVYQAIRTNDNQPADVVKNDIIAVMDNQVWVGSNSSQEVFVSSNTSFTSYTFSSPRAPGEGALLVLDNAAQGFKVMQNRMLITAGRDDWYVSEFQQLEIASAIAETLKIRKLKTSTEQAAQSADFIDADYYLSFEPCLRRIVGIDENNNLITENLSNPVKPDFDDETWTNGHLKVHKNRIYLSAPASDKIYIQELVEDEQGRRYRFWQPPQILPIRKFAIVSGEIYGHSGRVAESYKLFDGTTDNAHTFKALAKFAYNNYKLTDRLKSFDELLVAGYIGANVNDLKVGINYDYDGSTEQRERIIDGAKESILFQRIGGGSLGEESPGDSSLGVSEEKEAGPARFETILEMPPRDFHDLQIWFETDGKDKQWELLAVGPNVRISPNEPVSIKQ